MATITLIETKTIPLCPHCKRPLTTIETNSKGVFWRRVIYSCGQCHTLLSIGYDRWSA